MYAVIQTGGKQYKVTTDEGYQGRHSLCGGRQGDRRGRQER